MARLNALTAAIAAITLSSGSAFAGVTNYDFTAAYNAQSTSPLVINGATFSSPSDPGAFQGSANAGLYSVINSAYTLAAVPLTNPTLDISFAASVDMLSFNFAIDDFFGSDSLTVTANNGLTTTISATELNGDFYPEGSVTLGTDGGSQFTSVVITATNGITIGDVQTVPEPATLALLGTGIAGLVAARRRRRV